MLCQTAKSGSPDIAILTEDMGYIGGGVTMWQYTSTGRVSGISGNVDRDVSYKSY